MKKMILALTILAFTSAHVQKASAGDREWATAGKILTGVAAAAILTRVFDSEPVYYSAPCQPPTYYAAPAYCPPPVVYVQPVPVVVYRPPVYVRPAPVVSFQFGFRGHGHSHHHGHCR